MNWSKVYEKVLQLCITDKKEFPSIVEMDAPEFRDLLIPNPKANENSLYSFMLDSSAEEEDVKKFCEYIYNYIGLDIYDYL